MNANRELLRINHEDPVKVLPRQKVTKLYYHRDGREKVTELLFKVQWDQEEDNNIGHGYDDRRRVTVGTTLAIDWATKRVRAVLTSDHTERPEEQREQEKDRDEYLKWLIENGYLVREDMVIGPSDMPVTSAAIATSTRGVMRVHNTGCTLTYWGVD